MNNIFNDGFTEMSFLNIIKKMTEGLYDMAVNATSNINQVYNTKGLKLNYIEENELNACVWIKDNYDNMLINTGTISIIYAYFYTVFSNKNLFSKIGDSKSEANNIVGGGFNTDNKSIYFNGAPKDENRRMLANFMAQMSCRYICAHELGHLINGHAHLLNNLYGNQKVEMIAKRIVSKFNKKSELAYALDSRTLEMDADAFAATMSMNNIIGLYQEKEKHRLYFNLLENPIQIFELWSFAVHSIFMLFESYCSSSYEKTSFYLPNEAREALNLMAAKETIEGMIDKGYFKCSDSEKALIEKYFYKGIREAQEYFNATFGTKYAFIEQVGTNPIFNEYAHEVQMNWNNNLRHKLKKYSRAILYNPDGMNY